MIFKLKSEVKFLTLNIFEKSRQFRCTISHHQDIRWSNGLYVTMPIFYALSEYVIIILLSYRYFSNAFVLRKQTVPVPVHSRQKLSKIFLLEDYL